MKFYLDLKGLNKQTKNLLLYKGIFPEYIIAKKYIIQKNSKNRDLFIFVNKFGKLHNAADFFLFIFSVFLYLIKKSKLKRKHTCSNTSVS